jgi:hypothetical protein
MNRSTIVNNQSQPTSFANFVRYSTSVDYIIIEEKVDEVEVILTSWCEKKGWEIEQQRRGWDQGQVKEQVGSWTHFLNSRGEGGIRGR